MSLTHISERILEVPALERDFHEGALFDAWNEKIVIGCSLWNANDLRQIETRRNYITDFTMNASDTLNEKLGGLECDASVQLSILSGLIKMNGSLKYQKENTNNGRQLRVQARCLYKTAFKEMNIEEFKRKIRYLDIAKTGNNDTATHFVMKIQYAAGAIFNFTYEFQSEKEKERAEAEIKFSVNNILGIVAGGNVGKYNRDFTRQMRCEFHSFGFLLTEACPTTYQDAIKFASNLSRMVHQSMAKDRNGETLGVPYIVWLHPLITLPGCENAPKLSYECWYCGTCEFDLDDVARYKKLFGYLDKIMTILNLYINSYPFYPNKDKKRDETLKKIEEMTKFRSDSLMKLREMIVNVRSGRQNIHSLCVRLGNPICKKTDDFYQWEKELFNRF